VQLPTSRTTKAILVAVLLFTLITVKDLLIQTTGGKLGDYLYARFGVSTTTLVYFLILVLVGLLLLTILGSLKEKLEKEERQTGTGDLESQVREFTNSLKERYQSRYEQKLDGRFEITLEVSKDGNSRKAEVINERFTDRASVGKAVEVITAALAENDRLLIIGNPGAGKTVLLLKLAVSLLDRRDNSQPETFPVILNLASWSSEYEKFEVWLNTTLVSGYGLSETFAATLLHQDRIIFLLDGLDELARDQGETTAAIVRGACLRSLNQYLNRGKRVVICCRRNEFAQMRTLSSQDAPVSATVALLDLTRDQIRNALLDATLRTDHKGNRRDAVAAGHILEFLKLKRSKVLFDVLRTPFYFTTALEVFDSPILDDHHIPNKQDELRRYLLREFIKTKLYRTPNPRGYKPEKIQRWLNWLAVLLLNSRQTTFELSKLQLYHVQLPMNYAIYMGICLGLLTECFVWGALGKKFWGIGFPLGALPFPVLSLFGVHRRLIVTEDIRRWSFKRLLRWATLKKWTLALIVSAGFGYLSRLLFIKARIPGFSPTRMFVLVASILLVMLFVQIAVNEARIVSFYSYLQSPYQRLSAGIGFRFAEFSIVGLFVVIVLRQALRIPPSMLLSGFLLMGLTGFLTTPLFRHLMVRLCLSFEQRMPLRYATFLDFAAEARILEKDGGHWRFRHQNLADCFARLPDPANLHKKTRRQR